MNSLKHALAGAAAAAMLAAPLGFVLADTDTTPPTVTLTSATPDPTGANPIPVTATFSEAVNFDQSVIDLSSASLSNFVKVNDTTYTFDLTPNGSSISATINQHKFTDLAGNANETGATISRGYDPSAPTSTTPPDTTAPIVSITSGLAEGEATSSTAIHFEFTVDDASSTVQCSIGDFLATDSFFSCGSPQDYTLPNGHYRFAVEATDQASNVGSTSRTFTIDTSLAASSTATSTGDTGGTGGMATSTDSTASSTPSDSGSGNGQTIIYGGIISHTTTAPDGTVISSTDGSGNTTTTSDTNATTTTTTPPPATTATVTPSAPPPIEPTAVAPSAPVSYAPASSASLTGNAGSVADNSSAAAVTETPEPIIAPAPADVTPAPATDQGASAGFLNIPLSSWLLWALAALIALGAGWWAYASNYGTTGQKTRRNI